MEERIDTNTYCALSLSKTSNSSQSSSRISPHCPNYRFEPEKSPATVAAAVVVVVATAVLRTILHSPSLMIESLSQPTFLCLVVETRPTLAAVIIAMFHHFAHSHRTRITYNPSRLTFSDVLYRATLRLPQPYHRDASWRGGLSRLPFFQPPTTALVRGDCYTLPSCAEHDRF